MNQRWESGSLSKGTKVFDNPAAGLRQAWLQPSSRGWYLARTAEYLKIQIVIALLTNWAEWNFLKTGIFASGVCSQGNPWFAKRMWGHSYCLGVEKIFWKWWLTAHFPSLSSDAGGGRDLLDLRCPSSALLLSLPQQEPHMSHLSAAVPAQGICRGICMLQGPVELPGVTGAAWMALNRNKFQFFTVFQLLEFLVSLCTSHAYLPRDLVSCQDLSSSTMCISMLNTAQAAASQ